MLQSGRARRRWLKSAGDDIGARRRRSQVTDQFARRLRVLRAVSWDDIGRHPYMTVAKSSGNRMVLDRARTPGEKQLQSMVEVRHVSTLLEMVRAGLGIAVVPQLAMPAGSDSVLRAVAMKDAGITRTLGVIRRAGRVLSPGAQHFYEMMKEALPRGGQFAD